MKVRPTAARWPRPERSSRPVRVHHRDRRRQRLVGLVVVDDDHVHAQALRLFQRLDAGGAAIDGHDQRGAAGGERAHRLDIRAIALEQPVGDVDQRIEAAAAQEQAEQGGRGGAVDIVIAEDRDRLAAHRGVGNARGRRLHCGEHIRVGHQVAHVSDRGSPAPRRPRHRGRRAPAPAVPARRAAARLPAPAHCRGHRAAGARCARSPSARRQERPRARWR